MGAELKPHITIGTKNGRIVVHNYNIRSDGQDIGTTSGPYNDHAALAFHLLILIFPVGEKFKTAWNRLKELVDIHINEAHG